jgi:hypothetical protein
LHLGIARECVIDEPDLVHSARFLGTLRCDSTTQAVEAAR